CRCIVSIKLPGMTVPPTTLDVLSPGYGVFPTPFFTPGRCKVEFTLDLTVLEVGETPCALTNLKGFPATMEPDRRSIVIISNVIVTFLTKEISCLSDFNKIV